MAPMHLFIRCFKRFGIIAVFIVAFIISLYNVLTYEPEYTKENSRDYNSGSNVSSPIVHALPGLARKPQWFVGFSLSEQQSAVKNWELSPDPHDFEYLINPVDKCYSGNGYSDPFLIIFVNSAPGNAEKRAYIRDTFGNFREWPTHDGTTSVMRIVFLLGAVNDDNLQADINIESEIYNDIVQESFIDDYLNMTRKTIMGMKWVTNFCRNARYTMKVDDDVLINAPLVYEILQTAPSRNFTYGTVQRQSAPVRITRGQYGKFYTPKSLYPAPFYPPYFNGHAYILSTDLVEEIYRVSMETDLFPWSDVFVGMCLRKLGIRLRHSGRFLSHGFPMASKGVLADTGNALDIIRECVSVFHFSPPFMNQLWDIWTRKL